MKKPKKIENENHLRRFVHGTAEQLGYHVSHVESHSTSCGIPDLNLARGSREIWLELKVDRKGFHMLPSQRKWHKARAAAGGKSYIVCYQEGTLYLHNGPEVADLMPSDPRWLRGQAFPLGELPGLLGGL